MVDLALAWMEVEFEKLYSQAGCPSIAPERLRRAILSERRLVESHNCSCFMALFAAECEEKIMIADLFP